MTGSVESTGFDEEQNSNRPLDWENVNDSGNPFNWNAKTKWTITLLACYVTFIVGINSTSITSAAQEINQTFHISDEYFAISFWPVTAWNVGAALAPMVVLPIMEDFGMRIGYLVTYIVFLVFVIPQAVAQNFSTLIICRFFAGCCGGVLQDVMDGIIADIWPTAVDRSLPVTWYVFSLLAGVTLGPVIGGAIVRNLIWRWIFYIQLIIYGCSVLPIFLIFRETRGPVILHKRFKRANQHAIETYSMRLHRSTSMRQILFGNIVRPAKLLCTEPVVFFFTLLSALSYGLVFVSTQSVTQVYETNYSWEEYQAGLVQVSIFVGEFFGFGICLYQNTVFLRAVEAASQIPNTHLPEVRLYFSIIGSFLGLAGGLFWYGWTSYSFLPWILPSIGLGIIGFGSMVVMQAIMMYVTDTYTQHAGSASAAICFGENLAAAFLPLAAKSMYTNLGFQWASSLLAFIALALSFGLVILVFKGQEIRNKSVYMSV